MNATRIIEFGSTEEDYVALQQTATVIPAIPTADEGLPDDDHESVNEEVDPPCCCLNYAFFLGALFGTVAACYDVYTALHRHNFVLPKGKTSLTYMDFSKLMYLMSNVMYVAEAYQEASSTKNKDRWLFPLIFGTGALLGLLVGLVPGTWFAYVGSFVSAFLFVFSSILTIFENIPFYTRSSMLAILIGDALFLAGSLVDLSLCYWSGPSSTMGPISEAGWCLVSSLLWLIDAIAYRLVDVDLWQSLPSTRLAYFLPISTTQGADESTGSSTCVTEEDDFEVTLWDATSGPSWLAVRFTQIVTCNRRRHLKRRWYKLNTPEKRTKRKRTIEKGIIFLHDRFDEGFLVAYALWESILTLYTKL